MSSYIARKVVQSFQKYRPSDKPAENLTKRETDVLSYVARGYTNKEIAEKLVITTNTVKRHLKAIFEKLDVHTRSAATAKDNGR